MKDPLVSIIIPTKNSSITLPKCLDSIATQTYKNIEIIIVDNNSEDATINIGKRYTNKIFTLGPERSAQVNYGVSIASGKYIYRVDSDFVLDSDLIREAVSVAELNNYAAILIPNTSDENVSFWAKVRKFEREMCASDNFRVAVRFIRKDIFLSVGGLDPYLVAGEDYDLHNRIARNYDIGKIVPKELHIGEYQSIKEVAKKHYYYGKTITLFLDKNKAEGFKQLNPFRRIYLSNYKEFVRHPDLTLGFAVYQIVRYCSSACGILTYKLRKFHY